MTISHPPTHLTPPSERRSRNPLWILYECWAMASGLGLFLLLCIGAMPVFLAFRVLVPDSLRTSFIRRWISGGFRFYLAALRLTCATRCDVTELATLKNDGPLIVIANHPSLLDAVILIAQLPNATCIMKEAVSRNPLYWLAARLAGYVSNGNAEAMLERSRSELAAGSHFIFFPEGGRSRQFPISPFSSSCVLLAKLTRTPVQTVLMDYSSPYLGKRWGLLSRPNLPLLIRARLGKRFLPEELRSHGRQTLESYFRSQALPDWQ